MYKYSTHPMKLLNEMQTITAKFFREGTVGNIILYQWLKIWTVYLKQLFHWFTEMNNSVDHFLSSNVVNCFLVSVFRTRCWVSAFNLHSLMIVSRQYAYFILGLVVTFLVYNLPTYSRWRGTIICKIKICYFVSNLVSWNVE